MRQAAEVKYQAKERELVASLQQAEQRLAALEQGKTSGKGGENLMLDAAQEQELNNFRQEKLRIRKELRDVRHQLGKDIETLETWIKVIHLGIIPLLIAVVGIWLGLQRAKRRYSTLSLNN